ncbi:hypothetical protein GCM10009566_71880 [Streptomyces murinus]
MSRGLNEFNGPAQAHEGGGDGHRAPQRQDAEEGAWREQGDIEQRARTGEQVERSTHIALRGLQATVSGQEGDRQDSSDIESQGRWKSPGFAPDSRHENREQHK